MYLPGKRRVVKGKEFARSLLAGGRINLVPRRQQKKSSGVTRTSELALPTTPSTASGISVKASSKPKNCAALLPSAVLTALGLQISDVYHIMRGSKALPRVERDGNKVWVLDVNAPEDEVERGLGSTVRADSPGNVLGASDGGNPGRNDRELGLLRGLQ
jgi:hypothetical protein